MVLADFEVAGITNTNEYAASNIGLVSMSRKAALEFLEMDGGASYMQVFLHDRQNTEPMQAELTQALGDGFQVRNWQELNPYYKQANRLYQSQYIIISIVLFIFVFFALIQVLSQAFNERINEYGTLESIGLKKRSLVLLLGAESLYLGIVGAVLGILFSLIMTLILSHTLVSNFILPGTVSEPLAFFITGDTVVSVCAFVLATTVLAMIIPISTVLKNSAIALMRRP